MGVVFFIAFVIIMAVYALYSVYMLAAYVAQGVSFMKLSKKLNVPYGWLGFVPVACYYQMGKLAEADNKRYNPEKKGIKWSVLFPVSLGIYNLVLMVALAIYYVTAIIAFGLTNGANNEPSLVILIVVVLFVLIVLLNALAFMVICYAVYYKTFHALAGKSAVWMLALSILVPVSVPVLCLVLAFSKKYPVAVPVKGSAEPLEVSAQDATAEPFGAQDEPAEHPEATEQQETANGAE